jgi:hypothetical protein
MSKRVGRGGNSVTKGEQELLVRIEELERRVKELESKMVIRHHTPSYRVQLQKDGFTETLGAVVFGTHKAAK